MGTGGFISPRVKRQGREADHSPPASSEVKNTWNYTSTPPYRLHGVVLNYLSTGATLPYLCCCSIQWSGAPDGARHQDGPSDWPSVVTLLWLNTLTLPQHATPSKQGRSFVRFFRFLAPFCYRLTCLSVLPRCSRSCCVRNVLHSGPTIQACLRCYCQSVNANIGALTAQSRRSCWAAAEPVWMNVRGFRHFSYLSAGTYRI
jgi:hypothetical protein